ncbi:MAG: FAD-dependent oxidoreductase, partial [Candidatus Gottesmanbacteria bacterium]|nr:FAD-dependent oxidoreductase [Candidatus Gottesmanbacteria bacterium]
HDVSPMGPYSKWALVAKVGDPMEFMGPLGAFILDRESHRKKVFVGTGTGVTPFHSMILDCISDSEIVLYWGLRHEEDIFWQKEFEQFLHTYPNFRFVLTLSQPMASWQESASRRKGHVQDHIFNNEKNIADSDYYLCGSKEMVNDMREKLKSAGVPNTQVKFELFY